MERSDGLLRGEGPGAGGYDAGNLTRGSPETSSRLLRTALGLLPSLLLLAPVGLNHTELRSRSLGLSALLRSTSPALLLAVFATPDAKAQANTVPAAPANGGSAIIRYEYVKKAGSNDFEPNWTQIPDSASLTS